MSEPDDELTPLPDDPEEPSKLSRSPYIALGVAAVVVSTVFATVAALASTRDEAAPAPQSKDTIETSTTETYTTDPTETSAPGSSKTKAPKKSGRLVDHHHVEDDETTTEDEGTTTGGGGTTTRPGQPDDAAADEHHDHRRRTSRRSRASRHPHLHRRPRVHLRRRRLVGPGRQHRVLQLELRRLGPDRVAHVRQGGDGFTSRSR